MKVIKAGNKEAVRFVTQSGVKAIIATSIPSELLRALARKLERKLRKSGHMPKGESKSVELRSIALLVPRFPFPSSAGS